MFKEFKPTPAPKLSREEIGAIFQKADFHTAPQECRKAGYKIAEFQNDIEIGAEYFNNKIKELNKWQLN